jgi:hypothetical protein
VAAQAPVLVQGVAELEHARAEAEPELGPVAAELELVQAAAELEHDPVVAELALVRVAAQVPNPRPDQLEARQKTKWATEAHHRDLARLLAAVEDLAAVVETTRAPAATEAVVAWAAAV